MNASSTDSAAVAPPAWYLGGKRRLADRVIARLARIPHESYVEPFVGMGGVFLRRPVRARCEVINDLSGDVANLFRILQRHYGPLMDMLRWQMPGRAEFDRLNRSRPDTLTDLERAVRFIYLQRLAFGGRVVGRTFGVQVGADSRFDARRLSRQLEDVHDRLAGVVIEQLPWAEVIRRYDRAGTLFYLDPPYFGCEGDYGDQFPRSDFAALAAALGAIKGRFVMSLNGAPEIRDLFRAFEVEEVETDYSIGTCSSGKRSRVGELLISGPVQGSAGPG